MLHSQSTLHNLHCIPSLASYTTYDMLYAQFEFELVCSMRLQYILVVLIVVMLIVIVIEIVIVIVIVIVCPRLEPWQDLRRLLRGGGKRYFKIVQKSVLLPGGAGTKRASKRRAPMGTHYLSVVCSKGELSDAWHQICACMITYHGKRCAHHPATCSSAHYPDNKT